MLVKFLLIKEKKKIKNDIKQIFKHENKEIINSSIEKIVPKAILN